MLHARFHSRFIGRGIRIDKPRGDLIAAISHNSKIWEINAATSMFYDYLPLLRVVVNDEKRFDSARIKARSTSRGIMPA